MDLDGKGNDISELSTSCSSTGKIMLTLVTLDKLSDTLSGYHHSVIPFPPSYRVACAEAKKAFAKQISQYTAVITLRKAAQRKDGQYVWTIIPEDNWETSLQRDGEELGVFLMTQIGDKIPEKIPYSHPKKLVWFQIGNQSDRATLQVVRSYEDCLARLNKMKESNGWLRPMGLKYDRRMVGCEADRKAYREHELNSPYPGAGWAALNDAEVFEYLVGLYTQPLRLQIF